MTFGAGLAALPSIGVAASLPPPATPPSMATLAQAAERKR
jgi:hypothetical protein